MLDRNVSDNDVFLDRFQDAVDPRSRHDRFLACGEVIVAAVFQPLDGFDLGFERAGVFDTEIFQDLALIIG